MKVPRMIQGLIVLACINSCSVQEKKQEVTRDDAPMRLPDEVAKMINQEFPGALPYETAIDSILAKLVPLGIQPKQILWGVSTCVDDITNTKDKFVHPEIKGPFTFGGLGGLPFTGVTGIEAFAHHVPQDGTALVFLGPHIGYRAGEGWGKILRHEQTHSSSCCGALSSALAKLEKNELKTISPSDDDYQEQSIEQLALQHSREILGTKEPLLALTRVVTKEAKARMTLYAQKVKEHEFAYAVVVIGVIINTDYQYPDYLWVDHVAIKDIKKNQWMVGL
jgi:hypothetical protein